MELGSTLVEICRNSFVSLKAYSLGIKTTTDNHVNKN